MVERNFRLAPHVSKTSKTSLPKLFVLDTNVLMHDPTSLYRFEEHDLFLPILTLEELDNNKKGVTEVARNARQASRFLDDLVTHMPDTIAAGIPLDDKSGNAAAVPADRGDHGGAAGLARERQDRQPDPRRRHAPDERAPRPPRGAGVERHQHADQGARAR